MRWLKNKKRIFYFLFLIALLFIIANLSETEKILNNAVNLNRSPAAETVIKKGDDIYLLTPTQPKKAKEASEKAK